MGTTHLGQLPQNNLITTNVTSTKLNNDTHNTNSIDANGIINNVAHMMENNDDNHRNPSTHQPMLNGGHLMDNTVTIRTNNFTGIDVPKYLHHSHNNIQRIPKVQVNSMDMDELDRDSILSASMTVATTIQPKVKPRIPDGGFGWVIVFASFVISVIIDGIAFSFGLIYTELLNYFKESKTKTAWIGAFHLAVPLLAGPILSNLVDKYGCRTMTIIGGLIAGIGFVLSSLANSVEMLYLTFGLISGVGIGIGYVTAVVSIAFWFDKKRE